MNDGADTRGARVLTLSAVVVKAAVTHTVTYFAFGLLALFAFDYARLFAETKLEADFGFSILDFGLEDRI
jgi:hypothetical protein